jgi:hypothetical protein
MEAVFQERTCGAKHVPFLKEHFDHSRLYDEKQLQSAAVVSEAHRDKILTKPRYPKAVLSRG